MGFEFSPASASFLPLEAENRPHLSSLSLSMMAELGGWGGVGVSQCVIEAGMDHKE